MSRVRQAWLWAPLALWAGAIVFVSSLSRPPTPRWEVPQLDKFAHLAEYAILGALLARALLGAGRWRPTQALAAAIVAGALFGASDELHQLFVPGRFAEVLDFLVDALGVALGAAGYRAVFRPSAD